MLPALFVVTVLLMPGPTPTPTPTVTPTITPTPAATATPTPLPDCSSGMRIISPGPDFLEAATFSVASWNRWLGCRGLVIAEGGVQFVWADLDHGAEFIYYDGPIVVDSAGPTQAHGGAFDCVILHETGHILGYTHEDGPGIMDPAVWWLIDLHDEGLLCSPEGT
jgi:hypothetical protein